ncbi:HNH endonuclease signature motif containing protein [Microbacterium sp. BK668]|uniref:HNH endonuclease signature motif containing protein n=1 Tax=Microbacterium sp. BK668 TaxID=2512118 RepID=UPI001060B156|nr:HNH endonuclease signature motif containing protein [Microbacterium sp. BK668]
MSNVVASLQELGDAMVQLARESLAGGSVRAASDAEVLDLLAAAARISRAAEAFAVEATVEASERSSSPAPWERMTTRLGCRSVSELVQRSTRVSRRAAADMITAAGAVGQPVAPTTGALLPAEFPGVRAALMAGDIGIDGVVAIAVPLRASRAGRAAILAADEELAAAARGEGADAAPAAPADELRAMATAWAMYLDPDGVEPREAHALRKRGLTLGVCREGVVPVRGNLLPEVAGQLERLFDSILNPKAQGPDAAPRFVDDSASGGGEPVPAEADHRTRVQKQHDALATVLTVAAASGSLPQLGGAAPTLVLSVRAADLRSGSGFAHIDGSDEPVSLASAHHVACSGAVQKVALDDGGRIVALGSLERVFTHHQRRAIGLRDGHCVIPGCQVRAAWCEIHHVEEHAHGGPTHTDNGVLLCWFHHRTLDSSGWRIRMNHGVPEVRGPYWWDAGMRWRPVTKSPTRIREQFARRN